MEKPIATQPVVFSFDVEEHHRIEAAAGMAFPPELHKTYQQRMETTTRQLLDLLAEHQVQATFFIVGEIAKSNPQLVRDIASAGHEIGSHSWTHTRVCRFEPHEFREDLRVSQATLEDVSGQRVVGFRAPTFSIDHRTPWAIDILAELGFRYDSSIFPVRHDRYGVPEAPRLPFRVRGNSGELIELPPTTYRFLGQNLPIAGGGYFRLFPLAFLRAGVNQLAKQDGSLAMLYFHPWEFDADQPRLPLKPITRWRTYVGISGTIKRLRLLLDEYGSRSCRAIDFVESLEANTADLTSFKLGAAEVRKPR